jgi:predicted house-cleaning noncanonical NTP pyrophosphatase (MazG superfamily)
MVERKVKSGPEIVKEFVESLEKDELLDKSVVEIIKQLHTANNLSKIRLLQALETNREESDSHG